MDKVINHIEYNELISLKPDDEDTGKRIDVFLSDVLQQYSRSFIQKLFDDKYVKCNNKIISKNYKIKCGDLFSFLIPEPKELNLIPENIPIEVCYEDSDLLVVNKPKGMVVHPAPGNYEHTLVNALLYYCGKNLSSINGVIRPGIVHRIDKDTSGLLLIAKNDKAHISLSEQIKSHSLDRQYHTVVHGNFKDVSGTVDAPIGRSSIDRKKMCVTKKNSKNAVTDYTVLNSNSSYSYLICKLHTGRTHQIRVHMAYIGHPVAGDTVYGPKGQNAFLNGQCLHAASLQFIQPTTNQMITVCSDLPDYFKEFLNKCKL
ncbi:MAG: RluA family pseudouridine synthase [Clostridiales bacterium]|nr:RluA family pseudouridine synthase [Clostridiales bacterium]